MPTIYISKLYFYIFYFFIYFEILTGKFWVLYHILLFHCYQSRF